MQNRLSLNRLPNSVRATGLAFLVFAGLALVVYIIAPENQEALKPTTTAAMDLAPILPPVQTEASAKAAPALEAPEQAAVQPPTTTAADQPKSPAPSQKAMAQKTSNKAPTKFPQKLHKPVKTPKKQAKRAKPAPIPPLQTASLGSEAGEGYQILFESEEALDHLIQEGEVTRYLRRSYPVPTYWMVMDEKKETNFFKSNADPSVIEVPQSQITKLHNAGLYQLREKNGELSDHVVSLSSTLNHRLAALVDDKKLSKARSILMIKGNGDVEVMLARKAG